MSYGLFLIKDGRNPVLYTKLKTTSEDIVPLSTICLSISFPHGRTCCHIRYSEGELRPGGWQWGDFSAGRRELGAMNWLRLVQCIPMRSLKRCVSSRLSWPSCPRSSCMSRGGSSVAIRSKRKTKAEALKSAKGNFSTKESRTAEISSGSGSSLTYLCRIPVHLEFSVWSDGVHVLSLYSMSDGEFPPWCSSRAACMVNCAPMSNHRLLETLEIAVVQRSINSRPMLDSRGDLSGDGYVGIDV